MEQKSKNPEYQTVAPLANVSLAAAAVERALGRPQHLPGMVCLYGPAGWGKSRAATYVALKYRGYYIQCQETWTTRAILHYILQTMGIPPKAQCIYSQRNPSVPRRGRENHGSVRSRQLSKGNGYVRMRDDEPCVLKFPTSGDDRH